MYMVEIAKQHIQTILYAGFVLSAMLALTVCVPYLIKQYWNNIAGACFIVGSVSFFALCIGKQVELEYKNIGANFGALEKQYNTLVAKKRH